MKKPCRSGVCLETKAALLIGPLLLLASIFLSGCWTTKELPPPATDPVLTSAEGKLDYLQDKRVSRASAAVMAALMEDEAKANSVIKGELDIARSLLGEPTADDLAWAIKRAEKDDDAYYLAQLDDTKAFLDKVKAANKAYEDEKARLQAEHNAGLSQMKLELKAKEDEKWTWTAIGLFLAGMAAIYFGAGFKQKALGGMFIIGAIIAGAIPRIQSEPWFLYAVGGSAAFTVVAFVGFLLWKAKKEVACEEGDKPKENNGADDTPAKPTN